GFVANSAGTIHTSVTKAIAPGSTVQVRFRTASDSAVGAAGWNVDNIAFTGVVETPFATLVAEGGVCNAPAVTVVLAPSMLPAGSVGTAYSGAVTAAGGTAPYNYSITPVILPAGLITTVVNGSLEFSGTPTKAGTYLLNVKAIDSLAHQGTANYTINIAKGTPTITWSNPVDIASGMPLSGTQLNASANVSGTFTYTPAAGQVLNAGDGQTLSVNFVPTDIANYNNTSKSVVINVLKGTPTLTWTNPTDISYGTLLSGTQLNATTDVAGTFVYTPAAGVLLNVGDCQTLSVNFFPTDPANYNNSSANVIINVLKATPMITWSNPSDITYGAALSSTQLNASTVVAGTMTYTPASGEVLNAGNSQTLAVDFVPTDVANYNNASGNVSINVLKATPAIAWSNPADITYGAALSSTQLNASTVVAGTLTYMPASGELLNAGNSQTLAVDFVPTDVDNYNNASANVAINVLKATPAITWTNPADITYGAALSSTQLNASTVVAGTLTYTPASGEVLNAGNSQTLAVDFVPTDTANYNNASMNVAINVLKAMPAITWTNPADITYGAALSSTQLNASTSVSGTLTYTPASGSVPNAGNGQTLSVDFAPTDTANYNNASANVTINVLKATPAITWTNPADITYGAALSSTQLNATSSIPGAFSYTPGIGVVLNAGNSQNLAVAFVPTDTASYNNQSANVAMNVLQAGTATSVSSTINPSDLGQTITFTATVSSAAGLPTGTVQFKADGANIGGPQALNGSGIATFATSALTATTHTITAAYSGDNNFVSGNGTLSGGQVVRGQPSLSIGDVSLTEGDSGAKLATFTVTLSSASNLSVTVNFATSNGTADSADYQSASGTVTFDPTQTTQTISVSVNGDTTFEADEMFFVNLSNAVNAPIADNQGLGTILNDDSLGGVFSFSQASYTVGESDGLVTITVNRSGDLTRPANVDYATADSSAAFATAPCATVSGAASSRCDYTASGGSLVFAAGESSKNFTVLISQDAFVEGAETFPVTLLNATGGAVFGTPSSATVTINDDASEASTNPSDNTEEFVRAHYHDFLNREPDSAGLAFWIDNIDKCNDPARLPAGQTTAQCIANQRVSTSAAFFLSIEFQQTGYFVYRFNGVSFGNIPGTPVPVRFNEFMSDTQEIERNVVVGQAGWEAVLESHRQAFALQFVQRPEFNSAYPAAVTPGYFVDGLFTNAGVIPLAADRSAAINEFGAATTSADVNARARALRRVADNTRVVQQHLNRAFVLMQYFGYLRRNPDAAPETTLDFGGYNFWLNKLDEANGDFIAAEMVKAFITSGEYRNRFGN
ncbi:MAG: hypothetical protein QOD33_1143, partial [Pyrinomonadaceae bacterium]|nr:hypothetical protein [Pyrinomonadaceae bacterium]